MKIKIERHGNSYVGVSRSQAGTVYKTFSWSSLEDYLKWTLVNWDRLPQKFASSKVEQDCKKALQSMLSDLQKEGGIIPLTPHDINA